MREEPPRGGAGPKYYGIHVPYMAHQRYRRSVCVCVLFYAISELFVTRAFRIPLHDVPAINALLGRRARAEEMYGYTTWRCIPSAISGAPAHGWRWSRLRRDRCWDLQPARGTAGRGRQVEPQPAPTRLSRGDGRPVGAI